MSLALVPFVGQAVGAGRFDEARRLVRSFVDLGQGLRPLLEAVAERHPDEGNVEAILEAFEAQGRQILVQTEPPA